MMGQAAKAAYLFFALLGFIVLLYYYYIFIILFLSSFSGSYLLQKADFKIDILSVLKIYLLSIFKIYLIAILKSIFHRFQSLHCTQSKFLQNFMLFAPSIFLPFAEFYFFSKPILLWLWRSLLFHWWSIAKKQFIYSGFIFHWLISFLT